MKNAIAQRRLHYLLNGESHPRELIINIYAPYLVAADEVNFAIDEATACCVVEITGLPESFEEKIYGADPIQALQLAVNIDPILKHFSKKYQLFFTSGEPYFES